MREDLRNTKKARWEFLTEEYSIKGTAQNGGSLLMCVGHGAYLIGESPT